MNWISWDLDWCTGDCRDVSKSGYRCSRRCPDHLGRIGRPKVKGYFDTEQRFNEIITMLTQSTILSPVIVRDCHGDIFDFLTSDDCVWNIDFHTDDYDIIEKGKLKPLACWNWVNYCQRDKIAVTQSQPADLPNGEYRLFIAVSLPYTNARLDNLLVEFLANSGWQIDLFLPDLKLCKTLNSLLERDSSVQNHSTR